MFVFQNKSASYHDKFQCYEKYFGVFFFFETAIWLLHGQLWTIVEGIGSLTRC